MSKYAYEKEIKKADKRDKTIFTTGKFIVVAAAAAAAGAFTYSMLQGDGSADGGCDTAEQSALRTRNF